MVLDRCEKIATRLYLTRGISYPYWWEQRHSYPSRSTLRTTDRPVQLSSVYMGDCELVVNWS